MSQLLEVWELAHYGNDGRREVYETGTKSALIKAHNDWVESSGNFDEDEIKDEIVKEFNQLTKHWDIQQVATIDLSELQDGDTYNGAYNFAIKHKPDEEKAFLMEFTFRIASKGKNRDELIAYAQDEFISDSYGYIKDLEYGLADRWVIGEKIDLDDEDYFGSDLDES